MLGPTQREPGARLELARQHAREHGLARAVRPHDADALPARDHELDIEQHRVLAEREVGALERDHALAAARGAA